MDISGLEGHNDAKDRYDAIFKLVSPKGKTLVDVCCGNGYFLTRFMLDGGKRALGVEISPEVRGRAYGQLSAYSVEADLVENLDEVSGLFDYALYLDTHYHQGTEGYLEKVSKLGKVCFISSSYSTAHRERSNERLEGDLRDLFEKVEFVFTGNNNRNIYRCE